MTKKIEFYEGKPVFQAKNSKELAEAVAKYEGEVKPPYVVRIPYRTKKVKERAFHDNGNVGVVLFSDTVTEILEEAFYACENLSFVQIPDTIDWIGDDAFQMCTSLSSIRIPDAVTYIGDGAFYGCENLERIVIPDSVLEIGEDAFKECANLKEIRINNRQLLKDVGLTDKVEMMSLYGITLKQFLDELRQFASKYPDRKVACMLDDGTPFYINDIDGTGEEDAAIVLSNYMDEGDDYTVADFLKISPKDYDLHEVVIKYFNTNALGVEYACVHTIAEFKSGIFFKAKDGEKDIIAFRPGFMYDDTVDDGEDLTDEERAKLKAYWDNNKEQEDYRKMHVFQDAIDATVGQLVRDLKYIIKNNPGSTLSFTDVHGSDVVISGVRMWKGLALLKASWKEDEAITVETLLDLLKKYDEYTPVLVQMEWELRNLCVDEVEDQDYDFIFHYEEDEGYNYFNVASHDIRLFTPEDLSIFLEDYEHECPDRKIACQDVDGKLHLVTEIYDDDDINYIVVNDEEEGEDVTVSNLVNDFGWNHGGVIVIYGNKGVRKCIDDQEYHGIFFEDELDGEDVIAFRLGETLYDPEDDEDNDDGYFSDDDIIINADDPYRNIIK